MIDVRCPKCGTVRRGMSTPVGFQCSGCGARISVAANGSIRNVVPAKKK